VRDLEFQDRSAGFGGGGEGINPAASPILAPSVRSWTPLRKVARMPLGSHEVELAILQDKVAASGNAHLSALVETCESLGREVGSGGVRPGAQIAKSDRE